MKRTVILTIALGGFFLVSCKKDYSCNCTTYSTDPATGSVTESKNTFTINSTEKDAEIWCNGKGTSSIDPSGGIPSSATTCELTN